jgi:hypothetical protein
MAKKPSIRWRDEPEAHDYPAARSYLSLVFDEETARRYVRKLKRAPAAEFKAKDIFRASGLSRLGISNLRVERDRRKILAGDKLSPLLLVRDPRAARVIVADGYHRLCAVYGFEEDSLIACRIV